MANTNNVRSNIQSAIRCVRSDMAALIPGTSRYMAARQQLIALHAAMASRNPVQALLSA
jgi:hypothetical protein